MKKTGVKTEYFDRYVFYALIALEILMSFTFLGYIQMPPVSFTTAYIPILIAARLLGPAKSTAVGFVFGAASLFNASASYAMASDRLFSPFQSANPAGSLVLSVGTRMLFAFLSALMYRAAEKSRFEKLLTPAVTAASIGLHALLVFIAMKAFFPEAEALTGEMGIRIGDIVMVALSICIVEGSSALYKSSPVRRIKMYVDGSAKTPYAAGTKKKMLFSLFSLFLILMSGFTVAYFSGRMDTVLEIHEIAVPAELAADLAQILTQFLMAAFSLNAMTVLLLLSVYRYMSYKEYLGEIDSLTGVMGRRLFMRRCDEIEASGSSGWVMVVDVDRFKAINDGFGHAAGDKVLTEVASLLNESFGKIGSVGRVGGDEFAVLISSGLNKEALSELTDAFLSKASALSPDKNVSCSVGASAYRPGDNLTHILSEADAALYTAKESGRARCVFR